MHTIKSIRKTERSKGGQRGKPVISYVCRMAESAVTAKVESQRDELSTSAVLGRSSELFKPVNRGTRQPPPLACPPAARGFNPVEEVAV